MTPRPRPSHIVRQRERRLRGGMMTWNVVIEDGVTFVEASSAAPAASADVTTALLEACFAADTRAALLYAEQLPPAFFDLSSRVAGETFQRLRNYGVRLAVVVPPGWAGGSSRFGAMVAE